jgi:hypothetical protein
VVGFTTGSRGEVPGKEEHLWQEIIIIIIIIIVIRINAYISQHFNCIATLADIPFFANDDDDDDDSWWHDTCINCSLALQSVPVYFSLINLEPATHKWRHCMFHSSTSNCPGQNFPSFGFVPLLWVVLLQVCQFQLFTSSRSWLAFLESLQTFTLVSAIWQFCFILCLASSQIPNNDFYLNLTTPICSST